MSKNPDKVTWFEIPAEDVSRASGFYNKVFNWKLSDMGGGSKVALTSESDENMMPKEQGSINGDISPKTENFDKPLIIITVEDLDAKLKMVTDAGGEIIQPRKDIAEMNMAWAIIKDPEGNKIGVVENF